MSSYSIFQLSRMLRTFLCLQFFSLQLNLFSEFVHLSFELAVLLASIVNVMITIKS